MTREEKLFKDFRNTLSESEYAEVVTGQPNRSAHTDYGLHRIASADSIAGINAVLAGVLKSTFVHPNDAFIKMKVRLNVLSLDFDWTPKSWDGVGDYSFKVSQFGRVDGYDAKTGKIRFDGKASTPGGLSNLNLKVIVKLNADSLYELSAKLTNSGKTKEDDGIQTESYREPGRASGLRKAAKREAAEERAKWSKTTDSDSKKVWNQRGDEARKMMQDKLDKTPGIVSRWRKDAAAARAKKNVREDYDDMDEDAQTDERAEEMKRKIKKAKVSGDVKKSNILKTKDAEEKAKSGRVFDKGGKSMTRGAWNKEVEASSNIWPYYRRRVAS